MDMCVVRNVMCPDSKWPYKRGRSIDALTMDGVLNTRTHMHTHTHTRSSRTTVQRIGQKASEGRGVFQDGLITVSKIRLVYHQSNPN